MGVERSRAMIEAGGIREGVTGDIRGKASPLA